MAQLVKNPPAMREAWVQSLGWEDPLEKRKVPTPVFWPGEFQTVRGFPGSSDVKESTYNAGDPSLIPGLGSTPGEAYGNPLQYSCLENPNGQRSLAGYSPWGSQRVSVTKHSIYINKCMFYMLYSTIRL